MNFKKSIKKLAFSAAAILTASTGSAQIIGTHGYLVGDHVEVGVNANGHEGAFDFPGSNGRTTAAASSPTYLGFVANPALDGWTDYDGDFFTPGSPENGFGIQIAGINYSNNCVNFGLNGGIPGMITDYHEDGDCKFLTWEGTRNDVDVKVVYKLVNDELFYTTEVTLTNNTGGDLTDLYYYRNFDPDNNVTLSFDYGTTNTIVNQPDAACDKALVSATQTSPWASYVGLGAVGDQFRVSYGGFNNRNAGNIWNAIGLTGIEGASMFDDAAISLAYKIPSLLADSSETFSFVVILDASQVEAAISNLYYFDYSGGLGGPVSECSFAADTVETCAGLPVDISVTGPGIGGFTWEWFPPTGLSSATGTSTTASPSATTEYTAEGTPIDPSCFSAPITMGIIVAVNVGPQIEIINPGPQCATFDLSTLVVNDLNGTPGTTTTFHGSVPSGPTDMSDLWPSTDIVPGDIVYVMIADPVSGCYDVQPVLIDFSGSDAAGNDSTVVMCPDGVYNLHSMIQPGYTVFGSFTSLTSLGAAFNASTGALNTELVAPGTYVFTYTVAGTPPCPDDDATFTVTILESDHANFWFGSGTLSSLDGVTDYCISNTIEFFSSVYLTTGGVPTTGYSINWSFGDGSSSSLPNPTHTYSTPGTYAVTFFVTSVDGCVNGYIDYITIYDEPVVTVTYAYPSCNGFNDGSVTINTGGTGIDYDFTITNDIGTVINPGGSNTANLLTEGWYYYTVDDGVGCSVNDSIYLEEPGLLDADLIITPPLCYGDASGTVVVDTVYNTYGPNQVLSFFWSPNPAGIGGIDADSSYNMPAGSYVLTINDQHGCSQTFDFTIDEPEELVFSELGSYPAYCRLFDYQSGNGVVYAAAGGGTPDYTYLWTNLETGETTTNTTWGGLNPGTPGLTYPNTYQITVTDDNGCTLTEVIALDSLNPHADFEMASPSFAGSYEGTLPVEVTFTNTSTDFSNPLDPAADTTFFWNFNHDIAGWTISHDYFETFDTTYNIAGTYEICLVAVNKNGCTDTACKELIVYDPIIFTSVNIFTPDGDGINDVLTFEYGSLSIATFHCVIVNSWGTTVAELFDITDTWDGTDLGGDACSDGVYFYVWTATSDDGTDLDGMGSVTLLGD